MIHPTNRVLAAELPAHVGETVEVSGWLHRRRQLKSITFLILRDRSGLAQVILTTPGGDVPEETVLRVHGTVTANPQAPGGVAGGSGCSAQPEPPPNGQRRNWSERAPRCCG